MDVSPHPRPRMRRRRAVACIPCRKKKLKCDHQLPCSSCTRSRDKTCIYASVPEPRSDVVPNRSTVLTNRDSETPGGTQPAEPTITVERTEEHQEDETWHSSTVASILVVKTPTADGHGQGSTSGLPIEDGSRQDNSIQTAARLRQSGHISSTLEEELANPVRNVMVKTRYISPSSWLYSLLLLPHILAWLDRFNQKKDEHWQILQTCKSLFKQLKTQRTLEWTGGEYGKLLPSRALADLLVDAYLRTFESIYRIFHIPGFKNDYELLWEDPKNVSDGFIIQVQLCFALGALFHDDNFCLQSQAFHWIKEASSWLESASKHRDTMETIQTMCLLTLSRHNTHGIHGDRVWIDSGALIRAAMSIGLHRDPNKLPKIPLAKAEMRRRLWATVLELVLDSCLDPGTPPLISPDDFDCMLPGNFDDHQLDLDKDDDPQPKNLNQLTDCSVQIALGRSFAIRLTIAKFANGIKLKESNEEILKLGADFTASCRGFVDSLESLNPSLSHFQRQYCDMIICRYLFTLHLPYMAVSSKNPSFLLSRKACVDAALRLAHSALPFSIQDDFIASIRNVAGLAPQCDDFVRLCLSSFGPNRSVLFQAIVVIAAELMATIDESKTSFKSLAGLAQGQTKSNGSLREVELLSLLRLAVEWTRRRIHTGVEHNRDHMFVTQALTSIEAMMNRTSVQEAMDINGRNACLEVKGVVTELIGNNTGLVLGEGSSSEDNWPAYDESWVIPADDIDIYFPTL